MDNRISTIFLTLFLSTIIISCSNSKVNKTKQEEAKKEDVTKKNMTGPKVIIYKTKADYHSNVPVTLSEDKSEIVSYPGIKDVYLNGDLAYPLKLNEGFLLDNRGIDQNVAFLNYTYEQYSSLEKTPDTDELFNNLLDKDPISEMYNCGNKYDFNDIATELNKAIDNQELDSFQKIR